MAAPQKRDLNKVVVPCIYTIGKKSLELKSLELLTHVVRGATSFEDMRSEVVDGMRVVHANYYTAACLRGLYDQQHRSEDAFRSYAGPHDQPLADPATTCPNIRFMFAVCLAHVGFMSPQVVLRLYSAHFSADGADGILEISKTLRELRTNLNDHHCATRAEQQLIDDRMREQMMAPVTPLEVQRASDAVNLRHRTLNAEQNAAFITIMRDGFLSYRDGDRATPKVFFVDGPAGSGKTYLYRHLIDTVTMFGEKVLCCATSGIAATLLPRGVTLHRAFGLPLNIHDTSTSFINVQEDGAAYLAKHKFIVCDEMGAATKQLLAVVDRLLRDLHQNDVPMGGVTFVMGGDFRQCTPVEKRKHIGVSINNLLHRDADFWPIVKLIRLTANMRAANGTDAFRKFLTDIGNGTYEEKAGTKDDEIELPDQVVWEGDLIAEVFGSPIDLANCKNRAILCILNERVQEVNDKVMARMQQQGVVDNFREYVGRSYVNKRPIHCTHPQSDFDEITGANVAPMRLTLCVGAPVMLLKNLDTAAGMCNGTRLTVHAMHDGYVVCKFVTGTREGQLVPVPVIDEPIKDTPYPFDIHRVQLPLKLSFAMTVNKSQGQTLDKVGFLLQDASFSHGQLYVGSSRVSKWEDLRMHVGYVDKVAKNRVTRNPVLKEALLPP
ncbi:hypothetical protein B566_EDAN015004 [Ephemera danica]|nr:hypothetical protein B566_EDAN015004 [Ephemera danica]